MVYKFFEFFEPNYQLANELHKPVIRKFKKQKFIHHIETIFGVLI